MSERALGVSGRLLAGALILGSLVACTASEADGDSCLEREAVGYLRMESEVAEVFRDVDDVPTRVGSCADTGRPWTRLQATVEEWSRRKIAIRYFARRGWAKDERGFVSHDGAYRMEASKSKGAGKTDKPYVTVTFEEIADEAEWTRGREGD